MTQVSLTDPLRDGREAAVRYAWREAFELLSAADRSTGLGADDLVTLAEAAWWNGRYDDCIAARERAYAAYLADQQPRRAGRVAVAVARDHFGRNASSVGKAWVSRAERLLAENTESVEYGYLTRLRTVLSFEATGNFDQALAFAQQTLDIGTRFGDRDLMALGLHDRGRILARRGEVAEGMALIDEAALGALSGELTPHTTGIIYCNVISLCEEMADYQRAGEWTDTARRWCERTAMGGFPGICRVHRAQIIRLRGAWREAEQEARVACDELRTFNTSYAAEALYQIGEVRLRVGDLTEAEDLFKQAHELGREPQPGLAMLQLSAGRVEAAAQSIRRALSGKTQALDRARLLPTQVAVALATSDRDAARAAADELEQTADIYRTPALKAGALVSRGAILIAEGDPEAAVTRLREALARWREVQAPYEEAQGRLLLARAYRVAGDLEASTLEAQAAKAAFERLGAGPDVRGAAEFLGGASGAATVSAPAATRTFMFTDMVESTKLLEAIGDTAWGDVVRWHDETLRSLFAAHRGQEIDHAGDGFFVSFEDAGAGIDCAIAIQRTLADHRRAHGFAPQLRIGLHAAEARPAGPGFKGKGVHEAARIAALAQAGEIIASCTTVVLAGSSCATSETRSVQLKGFSQPVEIARIDWR
jgi:class 3 adenylate cyclase